MSRHSRSSSRTPRRQFLGELATTAAVLAAACAPGAAASTAASQAPAPTPRPPAAPSVPTTWDASWMERITAQHKAVFDSPEIADGVALYQAFSYLRAVKDVFGTGDADASVVVVLRHAAVPMLFNDAIWAKYEIGKETKTKDYRTKKIVTRNIYYQNVDAQGNPASLDRPSATIRSLTARGVIFVGCDLATRGFSYTLGRKTKQEPDMVYAELKQNLVPGATLMPTGIFATLLAQEKGCSFMKSS
jgi:hypothetical protein